MAKGVGIFHSDNVKGSVGRLTAASYRGIQTIRMRSMPSVSFIPAITGARALLGYLSRQWGVLTDEQRAEWEAYAENHPHPDGFGGTFIMTGGNAYVMLNHTAIRLGGDVAKQDTPPAVAPPAAVVDFEAVTGITAEGDIDLSWTLDGAGVATDFVSIRMTPPFGSKARVSIKNRFKFYETVAGNLEVDVISDLVVGKYYWFEARYVDQYGQTTAWQLSQATPKAGV